MFSIRNFVVFIAYKFNSRSITSFVRYVPRKCQKTVFSRFFKFRTRNMIVNNSRLVSDTKTFVYAMESKFSGLSAYIWLCSLFSQFHWFFSHIGYKSGFFSQILTLWRHSNHSFRDTRNYFIPIESPWNSIQPTFDVHSAADNTFLAKWQIMVKPPKTPFTPIFDLAPVWGPPPTIFKKTFFFF